MGASVSSGGGGKTPSANADINITPLVDVMLVLIIVFMVSAPMLEQGVEINLPQAAAEALKQPEKETIVVKLAIDRDQRIILSRTDSEEKRGQVITPAQLEAELAPLGGNENVTVNVEGDASLQYGYIAKVMATVRRAKITKINLVTQPTEDQAM